MEGIVIAFLSRSANTIEKSVVTHVYSFSTRDVDTVPLVCAGMLPQAMLEHSGPQPLTINARLLRPAEQIICRGTKGIRQGGNRIPPQHLDASSLDSGNRIRGDTGFPSKFLLGQFLATSQDRDPFPKGQHSHHPPFTV
jgi:hypothetical protein